MVVVYGTVNLDRLMRVNALPRAGGYAEVLEEALELGGEAANTAIHLKRWRRKVRLVGNPLGEGDAAEWLAERLKDADLEFELGTGPAPECAIYVTPDGERTMFGRGFAAMEDVLSADRFEPEAGAWFTAEPNHGRVAREVARKAASVGMRSWLMDFVRDDDPIPPGSHWQSSTDWAGVPGDKSANQRFANGWTGVRGCETILTDGPRGLVYCAPHASARFLPPFPSDAVDATGCGDAFRAASLYALEEGWPTGRRLAFAAMTGAICARTLGAQPVLPSPAEIEVEIDAHPEVRDAYRRLDTIRPFPSA